MSFGMGHLTAEQIHKNMLANKSKDTRIEVQLRKALWHAGVRYRKNFKVGNCRPDIVITKYKIAVFCDGDFWHGKKCKGDSIKTNTCYWTQKIKRNIERDLENTIDLRDHGWTVLRFWETDIINDSPSIVKMVLKEIESKK